jgi:hypothetical protein
MVLDLSGLKGCFDIFLSTWSSSSSAIISCTQSAFSQYGRVMYDHTFLPCNAVQCNAMQCFRAFHPSMTSEVLSFASHVHCSVFNTNANHSTLPIPKLPQISRSRKFYPTSIPLHRPAGRSGPTRLLHSRPKKDSDPTSLLHRYRTS